MSAPTILIAPDVAERLPGFWCATLTLRRAPEPALPSEARRPEDGLPVESTWTLADLKDQPVAARYRRLSWDLGIDPTKNRPSGEALARRILGGKGLPTIHPLVDAYNRASAATLVPLSAYDLDHTTLPLTVRLTRDGEIFHGIGREPEALAAGRVVYVDAAGPVVGVALWRDAQATVVRPTTRRALLMAVGAQPVPPEAGEHALDVAARNARSVGFVAEGPASCA